MSSLWLTADHTLNIAHRGASSVAPPNTLAAFRRAAELGADGVELDVHLSADGVAVVIHDGRVDRTTDGVGRVADLSLAALEELDAGAWFDPAFAGERIPTLDEVLAEIGGRLLVNVELKAPPGRTRELEATVAALVERRGLAERVLVSSFSPSALRRFRRIMPGVPLGLLYAPGPFSWAARLRAWLMRDLRCEAIHPHWSLLRPAVIRRAHARGQRVFTWTVDEPDVARQLAAWGVDGVITNHPGRLRNPG